MNNLYPTLVLIILGLCLTTAASVSAPPDHDPPVVSPHLACTDHQLSQWKPGACSENDGANSWVDEAMGTSDESRSTNESSASSDS